MAAKAKTPKRTAAQARKRRQPRPQRSEAPDIEAGPTSASARAKLPPGIPDQLPPQKLRLASGTPRARGQFRLGDAVGDLFVDDEGVVTFREVQ